MLFYCDTHFSAVSGPIYLYPLRTELGRGRDPFRDQNAFAPLLSCSHWQAKKLLQAVWSHQHHGYNTSAIVHGSVYYPALSHEGIICHAQGWIKLFIGMFDISYITAEDQACGPSSQKFIIEVSDLWGTVEKQRKESSRQHVPMYKHTEDFWESSW